MRCESEAATSHGSRRVVSLQYRRRVARDGRDGCARVARRVCLCQHGVDAVPRAAHRRGEEVPGAVRHEARATPRHRRARPLLARDLRATRR